jgi:hypothetical protein
VVIKRIEEECNCSIVKMITVNRKEKDENGKDKRMLEFHTKLAKKNG